LYGVALCSCGRGTREEAAMCYMSIGNLNTTKERCAEQYKTQRLFAFATIWVLYCGDLGFD